MSPVVPHFIFSRLRIFSPDSSDPFPFAPFLCPLFASLDALSSTELPSIYSPWVKRIRCFLVLPGLISRNRNPLIGVIGPTLETTTVMSSRLPRLPFWAERMSASSLSNIFLHATSNLHPSIPTIGISNPMCPAKQGAGVIAERARPHGSPYATEVLRGTEWTRVQKMTKGAKKTKKTLWGRKKRPLLPPNSTCSC